MAWEMKKLGDLFNITSSKRVFKAEWKDSGVPFYRAREIVKLAKHGYVDNELFISKDMYKEYEEKYGIPQEGDIMVTGVGTLGICYVTKKDDKFYFKDGNIIWLKKKTNTSSRYVEYAFKSDFLRHQIDNSNGATVGTYTIIKAKNTLIPVPPLPEQKHIVAILDEAFAGISLAAANAEKNLTNARELFESYLNNVFTQRGDDWTLRRLEDICSISSKLIDPREAEYINLPHIGAGNIVSMTGELIGIKTAKEEKLISGKFFFDKEMVLYSKIRPYLMKTCRPDFNGLCSADIYPLSVKPKELERNFLYYLLMSKHFTDYAIAGSARAGMPKVNRNHLFNYQVSIPNLSEQKKISDKLDELFIEKSRLESIYQQKLTALNELKQSILQKAFAGELTRDCDNE